jgi:hypothetical protein
LDAASYAFVAAATTRSELGRPSLKSARITSDESIQPSAQANKISKMLSQKKTATLKRLGEIRSALRYGPDTNPLEQLKSTILMSGRESGVCIFDSLHMLGNKHFYSWRTIATANLVSKEVFARDSISALLVFQ